MPIASSYHDRVLVDVVDCPPQMEGYRQHWDTQNVVKITHTPPQSNFLFVLLKLYIRCSLESG